jgi:hypothetical protein
MHLVAMTRPSAFFVSANDQPLGETPRGSPDGGKRSGREVSDYSTVCPQFASGDAQTRHSEENRASQPRDDVPWCFSQA